MSPLALDIHKSIDTIEQIKQMLDDHVPKMLRPNKWPGFAGVDIVEDSFIREHFFDFMGYTAGDDYIPVSSIVLELATWFTAAGMTPPEDCMYVIFLASGLPWACTYISLLSDISRIVLATEIGTPFAGSDKGAAESLKRAIDICETMFPETYMEIISVAHESLKGLRRGD